MFTAVLAFVCLSLSAPVLAQGLYSPELQVGDRIVTRYEIEQRARFLGLLNAPGDVRGLAREQLINEAVQLAAAEANGIEIGPDEIENGIAEFAARANLTAEQFITITQQAGISEGTVRDFFTAGVAWRTTVRARFGDDIRATISPDQVSRSMAQTGTNGGDRVLISEIVLPVTTPETQRASQIRADELARLPDEAAFAAAARRVSIGTTAANGGEREWVALDGLPDDVRSVIAALSPGQISRPVLREDGIALYLLRDEETVPAGTPTTLNVDYALFIVNGGPTDAAAVAARIDVCDDLYAVARGLPEERLIRENTPIAQLPSDVRAAVTGLDEGEISTQLTRSGSATVLMLCERTAALESTVDLEIVGNRLLNRRLGATAAHYLTTLRAETEVIDFTVN